jgi:alginate O-acetyltransferase complex protein AlgI
MAGAQTRRAKIGWLVFSLISNLGMLAFFKYGTFLLENFQHLMALLGVNYQPPKLNIVLPVGISFYTFQSLSYTIDVYRGELKPTRSLRDFAFFVAFFPQLVAGPIVRAADFLPQCIAAPTPRRGQIGWGLFLMTLGLFQKIVLADTLLSGTSEQVFNQAGPIAALDAWMGVLAFSGQIFFDFAGYSTCAIGAALCLGFSLNDNFRFPYAAIGFSDFWRRWHISLSTFLRDYLYIPLGGNRSGAARAAVNLIIVMLLGGLWHGAAWTFVVWGLVHGIFLVLERVLRHAFKGATWTDHALVQILLGLATYAGVCFAWVFFRAANFDTATRLLKAMVGASPNGAAFLSTREIVQVALVIAALLIAHWRLRNTSIEVAVTRQPRWLITGAWAVMAGAIILAQGNGNAFIYFQF